MDLKEWLELTALLNEWDPIGVYDPKVNSPPDEYDWLHAPLRLRLRRGDSATEIAAFVTTKLREHFALDPEPSRPHDFAQRLTAWFARSSPEARLASLTPSELASVWLGEIGTEDDDAIEYCYDIYELKGRAFYDDWLVALIELAESEDQIGMVAAGPIEAAVASDMALARDIETRVSRAKLASVLRRMWFDDATPEVKAWAVAILADGRPPFTPKLPYELAD